MILSEFLHRLYGVRRGGSGYVARCPAHDDKRPSLSLTEDSGRILIHCHAGCTTKQILDKLGLEFRDLYDKRITQPSRNSLGEPVVKAFRNEKAGFAWAPGPNVRKVHKVYPYKDENGALLYENVRYYPKDFRQRAYDENNRPVWNLGDVRRVPYRLPELIKAQKDGRDIFICEGEKDADALHELGFTATNLKGWKPEYNEYIHGQHVTIVQDHDKPGATMANEIARMILRSVASVKILDVWADRDMPDSSGPDISDYIRVCVQDEGLGAEEIKERICFMLERTDRWKQDVDVNRDNYFVVKSGNEWMEQAKTKPVARMLLGGLWYEGEVCMLFADTNVGKSILAVQAADAISRGTSVGPLKVECEAQKVVYFDFELTEKQFEARFSERDEYTNTTRNPFIFHRNFYRAEINPDTADLKGFTRFEDFLQASLDTTIVSTGAKVLVIDNLTYLRDETENARNALPLMKYLKELKSRHNVSILALAHTPKRDSTKPLSRNDLQGSKMIINFCDSSFAIGESHKIVGTRYIKQVKARNTEIIYHADNVLLGRIVKDVNFLRFDFSRTGAENDHLRVRKDKDVAELIRQAKELSSEGLSTRKIAETLGISHATVGRYLKLESKVDGTPSELQAETV
jgi:hypothetical protein